MSEPKPKWKNDYATAWELSNGSLVVKMRINETKDGHDHYYYSAVLLRAVDEEQADFIERAEQDDTSTDT